MYESVVGGLEEVEDSRRSCLEEKSKGEVYLSKISNTKIALVIATSLKPSTNPRRCACRRCCLGIGMILLDLVNRGLESGLVMQSKGILLAITAKSDRRGRNRKSCGPGGVVLIVGVNGNDDGSQVL